MALDSAWRISAAVVLRRVAVRAGRCSRRGARLAWRSRTRSDTC